MKAVAQPPGPHELGTEDGEPAEDHEQPRPRHERKRENDPDENERDADDHTARADRVPQHRALKYYPQRRSGVNAAPRGALSRWPAACMLGGS